MWRKLEINKKTPTNVGVFFVQIFLYFAKTKYMRKNVCIIAQMNEEGLITPLTLIWSDGSNFTIDKVVDVRKKASLKGGGMGIRFTCKIKNQEKHIWLDGYTWFVEI